MPRTNRLALAARLPRAPYVGPHPTVAYHRNGISGAPFYTVLFTNAENGRPMVATVFEAPQTVAVLDLVSLVSGTANDCYRGDSFEPELRAAIAAWEAAEHARWQAESIAADHRDAVAPVTEVTADA